MIRIAYILSSFGIGGAEQFMLDLCRRLDRRKFELRVIAVVAGGPMRAEFHEIGVPTDVVGKRSKLGFDAIRRLTDELRDSRPDIVHTQTFGGDTWGRIAALRAGVPHLISTEQNTNLDEGFVKRFVKRRLARRTDCIVAISEAVRSYSMSIDRIPMDRMRTIPNGVDLAYFRPQAKHVHAGARFVFIGRLVEQKGVGVLLDAFAILRDRLPGASLEVVGDGPLRGALEDVVRGYHLDGRVRFHGFQRDRIAAFGRADIVVMPSLWEGFGIVAAEAGAMGLPVIASSVGGLREVVVDGETGILVPPGDAKLLANAMEDLAHDRPRQVLLGHAARRHIERHYDIERVVERYEGLYAELLR